MKILGIESQVSDRHDLHLVGHGHPGDVLQPDAGEDRGPDQNCGQKTRSHQTHQIRRP